MSASFKGATHKENVNYLPTLEDVSLRRSGWIRRVAVVGLFLVVLFSLPSLAASCNPEDEDEESLVPFPPSIYELPYLELIEWAGKPVTLHCELLVCSISNPVRYNWFFSKNADESNTINITNIVQDGGIENFKIEGQQLIFNVAKEGDKGIEWGDYTGYYWCTAENEHGIGSSTKCQVIESKRREQADDIPPLTVKVGESVRVEMEMAALTPSDVPLDVFYSYSPSDNPDQMQIFMPKFTSGLEGKGGRFAIGDNFDLYIQQAEGSDSGTVGQHFREYGTLTTFKQRGAEIKVDKSTFYEGDQSGFFPGYEDYLIVRDKKTAYMTCIPKMKSKVKFLKDGKELELTNDNNQHVFRTDYAIWFNEPNEEDSGTYTCYKEDDPNVKVTKNLRVIGAPLIECDFRVFIIRTPDDTVKMSCTVTSDFLHLNEPQVFFDNNLFEPSESDVSFTKSIKEIKNGYNVEVASAKLSKKDSGVFRFVGSAAQMTKEEVIKKMKLDGKSSDKVYFNDYRILPFASREEVSVAVFVMPLKIKEHEKSEKRDALIGQENFKVHSLIYGSPLPVVTWFVDGEQINEDNALYTFQTTLSVVFRFAIRKVEKSVNITAFATHKVNGTVNNVKDEFRITAHEPLQFQPKLSESANSVNGKDANVFCAATQTGGELTASVVIAWLKEDGNQIFSGHNGFKIKGSVTSINGSTYNTSTLTFSPEDDSQHSFICQAKLVAGEMEHTLQTITHNVTVKTGEGPETPLDLQYDARRHLFSYTAQRIAYDYEMMDIIEMAQVFEEKEKHDPEWSKFAECHHYVGRAGWHDIKTSLGDLTDYEMEELPKGAKFLFRVYTQNEYGKSGYTNIAETITPDVEPTQDMSGVSIKPADDGSSKIVVSWDPYPREKFGSYDEKGCCIHVEVTAITRSGEIKNLKEDCVDPEATQLETGWSDLDPYTKHKVKTWFSNEAGETNKQEVEGYNAEGQPNKPNLSEDQPAEEPTEISVEFDSMTDEDLNGKFKNYEITVRDKNGNVLGNKASIDQGKAGEKVKLTVEGLTAYSDYTAEVIVCNEEFCTSTGQMPKKTDAAKPEKIDPTSIRVIVHPEGVVVFWDPIDEPNGIFKDYLIKFDDFPDNTTVDPFFDATDLFFDKDGTPTVDEKGYPFKIAAQNHKYTGEFTGDYVDFKIIKEPPENPRPPTDTRCDLDDPARLGAEWTYKQFGNHATSHSIIYATIDAYTNATEETDKKSAKEKLEDYNESCDPTLLTDTQHCYPEVHQTPGLYKIHLLARNKYGSAMSTPKICKATWPDVGFIILPEEAAFSTAGATLIMVLLLLLVLLIVLALIAVYYAKNRSHNYRVQKTESKYKPKDIEFLPRKDETNKFNEYVPDETTLPFISPHKTTGPVDLETDSFDGPYGGDEDLDGYNEDGSFIGAYVEDNVYRSA